MQDEILNYFLILKRYTFVMSKKTIPLLAEIRDCDFDKNAISKEEEIKRTSVRAIILDDHGNMCLLDLTNIGLFKLPGGGVEEVETLEQALHREILEEVGATVELQKLNGFESCFFGKIIEYRNDKRLKQTSYFAIAKVKSLSKHLNRTPKEIEKGQVPRWTSIKEAIQKLESYKPDARNREFIRLRELTALKHAQKLLKKQTKPKPSNRSRPKQKRKL